MNRARPSRRLVDGLTGWLGLLVLGLLTAIGGITLSGSWFVGLAALVLFGTVYAAGRWPGLTLVAAVLATLLDPVVAARVLPPPISTSPIGLSEPLLAVAGATILGSMSRQRLLEGLRDPTAVFAGAFVFVSLLSAAANRTPPLVATFGVGMTLDALVVFFLWRMLRADMALNTRAVTIIVAAGVVVAAVGVGQVLIHPHFLGFSRVASLPEDVGRITSFLGNPNIVGPVLGFVLPFPLLAALGRHSGRRRWLFFAVAVFLATALVLTYSRGAWLAVGVGILATAIMIDIRLMVVAAGVALVAALVAVGMPTHLAGAATGTVPPGTERVVVLPSEPPPSTPPPTPEPDPFRGRSSEDVRWYFVVTGMELVADHPALGVGPGRYGGAVATIIPSPVYDEYGITLGRLRTVHSFWLHILGETGIAGFVAFASLIIALVWRFARAARGSSGASAVILGGAAAAGVIAFANSFTEMTLEGNIPAVLIWLIFGIASTVEPGRLAEMTVATQSPAAAAQSGRHWLDRILRSPPKDSAMQEHE